MSVAVSVENIRQVYNKLPAVNDLSLAIASGEMFGLFGPSGAGKSTTIRQTRRLGEIIRNLNKQQGMTMVVTTHYMDEVEYSRDRTGITDAGKLIKLGTLQQLRSQHGEGLAIEQIGDRLKQIAPSFPNSRLETRKL